MSILSLQSLQLEIGDQLICRGLTIEVGAGQCVGILGKNGIGKTTLLYSIAGFHPLRSGCVLINNTALNSLRRRELARQVGILFQETEVPMPATVMEYVLLGRHPQASALFGESKEDLDLALIALQQMDLSHLRERAIASLSGGEKQRVAIACLLAQSPDLYLLDEPSNHLDIDFQIRALNILQHQTRARASAIVMATHDINLANRYCDSIVLMTGKGECLIGEAANILTRDNLSLAFECDIREIQAGDQRYFFPA